MKEWFPASLCVFFFWGIWGFLPKLSTRYLTPKSVVIYEVLGAISVGIVVLISLKFKPQFNLPGATLGIATGMFGTIGALAYLYAASKGPISIVSVVSALYPVLIILFSYFLLGETVSFKQMIGCMLALVSIALLAT